MPRMTRHRRCGLMPPQDLAASRRSLLASRRSRQAWLLERLCRAADAVFLLIRCKDAEEALQLFQRHLGSLDRRLHGLH